MIFSRKIGNMISQSLSNHIKNSKFSASNPCIFQVIRYMSSSKLFVGGIAFSADETSLSEEFNKYGEVVETRIITDRETGRSRGFGFVTYASGEEASAAIQALDGQELHGRRIRVNYANDRPRGFGGGGFGGGGGYSGGYGGGGYGGGGGGGFGGGYGASNYGSGTGDDGSGGGNYAQGGSYATGYGQEAGNSGFYGGSNQNFGVARGGGGSDSYANGGDGGSGSWQSGGDNQFGAFGADGKDDPMKGKNWDDDDHEPNDYASRRA